LTSQIILPPKLVEVFTPPRGAVRFRGAYGGRGSGKSYNFALMAAVWAAVYPMRILCTREFQASIRESFHAELRNAISSIPWLEANYDVGVEYIRCTATGSEFFFRGLRNSMASIKSMAQIDLTIVEEAEDIPEASWLALLPTVFRTANAEVWPLWNPRVDGSPVDTRFRKNAPKDAIFAEMNYSDNPFFPAHLDSLRRDDQRNLDPATYAHVWDGAYLTNSKATVFAGKYDIEEFTPQPKWDGPYQGGDFGFSQDPTAAVKCWINDNCLYIEYEAGKTGLELDDTAPFITGAIPEFARYAARWDNARPESISYLKRHGLAKSVPVEKGKNSVEDGVEFIKSFRRVKIHPRCKETINEFRLYSYKVDKMSGDVMPDLVDAHNHYIDALRYALQPIMKRAKFNWGAV